MQADMPLDADGRPGERYPSAFAGLCAGFVERRRKPISASDERSAVFFLVSPPPAGGDVPPSRAYPRGGWQKASPHSKLEIIFVVPVVVPGA